MSVQLRADNKIGISVFPLPPGINSVESPLAGSYRAITSGGIASDRA